MHEFNPINEVIKKQYEEALLHGKCRDPKTVRAVWQNINLYEKFSGYLDFKTFNKAQAMDFKSWLEKQRNAKGELLSLSTVRSILNNVREFFEWLAMHPHFIRKVDGRAVPYLNLSDNANRAARASRERTPPTLKELEKALKGMPNESDIQKRDRAIFAFMIITCVRDASLVSLKRKDVNAEAKTVWQDPKHVKTKFGKGIVTRFIGMPLPMAEEIVLEWLKYIDDVLKFKPNDPLFPKTLVRTNPEKMVFEVQGLSREHWANAQTIRDIFKRSFEAVDLPYYNPHLFRNTICKWGLQNLNQYEYKALSQNLGHEHAMTTYNSYAKLSESEQIEAIASIGEATADLQNIAMNDLLHEIGRRAGK